MARPAAPRERLRSPPRRKEPWPQTRRVSPNGVSPSPLALRRRGRQAPRAQRRSPPHPPPPLGRRIRLVSPRLLPGGPWEFPGKDRGKDFGADEPSGESGRQGRRSGCWPLSPRRNLLPRATTSQLPRCLAPSSTLRRSGFQYELIPQLGSQPPGPRSGERPENRRAPSPPLKRAGFLAPPDAASLAPRGPPGSAPTPPEDLGHRPNPGRPAHQAVAFETHQGIPAPAGKGPQAGSRRQAGNLDQPARGDSARLRLRDPSPTIPKPSEAGSGGRNWCLLGTADGRWALRDCSCGQAAEQPGEGDQRGRWGEQSGAQPGGGPGKTRENPMAGFQPPVPRTVPGPHPRTPQA
ncbi:basic salivary proline-rich protein 1-like [Moschus berezovskii]|uniref:basic salivary proline-rich protein 1-like n=1 Tax=Moschus berezovskii TaxID=68408 RepID=UPI002444BD06|nr:basic salivary proline-rich protein 1-like [Moschus berezovskii]